MVFGDRSVNLARQQAEGRTAACAAAIGCRHRRHEPGQSIAFQGLGPVALEMRQDGKKGMLPAPADLRRHHGDETSCDQTRQQLAVGTADTNPGRA